MPQGVAWAARRKDFLPVQMQETGAEAGLVVVGGAGVCDVLDLRCWLDTQVSGKQLNVSLGSRREVVGKILVFTG